MREGEKDTMLKKIPSVQEKKINVDKKLEVAFETDRLAKQELERIRLRRVKEKIKDRYSDKFAGVKKKLRF